LIQLIFLIAPSPRGAKKSIYTPSGVGASKLIFYAVNVILAGVQWICILTQNDGSINGD
jgi:hypothetical protein